MLSRLRSLLTSFLVTIPMTAFAGGANGGGGDALRCVNPSSLSPFSGYYSLDYLATYKKANANSDIINISSWADSADRIRKNLRRLNQFTFLASFERFYRNILNDSDFSSGILWKESGYGLHLIDDQELLNKIPANCLNGAKNELLQAVYWQDYNGLRVYSYDFDILGELEKTSALQISFLYIHEWLWIHFSEPEQIRILNRLIHSAKFDSISEVEFNSLVNAFDPTYPAFLQQGIYESSDGMRINFSLNLGTLKRLENLFSIYKVNVSYQFRCEFNSDLVQICRSPYLPGTYQGLENSPDSVVIRILDFNSLSVEGNNSVGKVFRFIRD